MKSLYEPNALLEITNRLNNLKPDSERLWGTMNPAQMMAHCTSALLVATGQKHPPRMFIGRILGRLLKGVFSSEEPFKKNTPTDKSFIFDDERDFKTEMENLIKSIKRFHEGGEARCTTHPHSFFGKLSAKEWGTGMYKHLDHHLRQFGV